jgi:stage II sporulation protein GA (sporulation sigma-E factor processing peptidase)
MVIYGEYLFVENFIVGLLLLLLTGKLTGYMPHKIRLLTGAIFCGISSFILFINLYGIMSYLARFIISLVCTLICFGIKKWLKRTLIFLVLTFLSGGIVLGLLMWQSQPALSHQGIIYADAITYIQLISASVLAFGVSYWFVKFIRQRNLNENIQGNVYIDIGGKTYSFRAYLDSGNSLKEPITNKPVVLIDKCGAEKLNFCATDMPSRYTIIPYEAVGTEKGSLEGVRTDKIIFQDKEIEGTYLAFYDGNFRDFEVLMNREFLEGGLLENE